MGAIANITAYDGEATPVQHLFKPIYVRNENGKQVAFYRESITGVPLDAQPTLRLIQETLKSGVTKLVTRVSIPVMESVNGQNSAGYTAAPMVAYTVEGDLTVFSPARATAQQRKNIRYLMVALLAAVTTAQGAFASGPVGDLVDDAISPT